MKTYTLKKITSAPDWKNIEIMPIDNLLWTDPLPITAQAQLCWDEEAIYLRMEAFEENIRKEETDPLAEICNDSCLEFFIQPQEGPYYLNFEINPKGVLHLGIGEGREERRHPEIDPAVFDIVSRPVEGDWTLKLYIPDSFLLEHFAKISAVCRANLYKCGDLTDHEHYGAWSEVEVAEPDYHVPDFFGRLYL